MGTPRDLKQAYMAEQLLLSEKAAAALRYSCVRVSEFMPLPENSSLDEIESELLERLEALAARFARLADILLQKLFRAIDAIELVDEGSLLDRLARMEKRGLIESAAEWRQIRELRNQVAHDYVVEDLRTLYNDIFSYSPKLIALVPHVERYAKNILGC